MTSRCRPRPRDWAWRVLKTCAAARPSLRAVSAVNGSMFAVARTPSVTKIFRVPFVMQADRSIWRLRLDPRRMPSFQTTGFPCALQDWLRHGAGAGGAVVEHMVHVSEVAGQFGTAGAGGGKIVPAVLEQCLLQVAVAEA